MVKKSVKNTKKSAKNLTLIKKELKKMSPKKLAALKKQYKKEKREFEMKYGGEYEDGDGMKGGETYSEYFQNKFSSFTSWLNNFFSKKEDTPAEEPEPTDSTIMDENTADELVSDDSTDAQTSSDGSTTTSDSPQQDAAEMPDNTATSTSLDSSPDTSPPDSSQDTLPSDNSAESPSTDDQEPVQRALGGKTKKKKCSKNKKTKKAGKASKSKAKK